MILIFYDTFKDNQKVIMNSDAMTNFDQIKTFLNWEEISKNKNISKEFIKENIDDCPWDFKHLSANPIVTTDLVESFPYKPWNWVILYINNKVPIELVKTRITSLDQLNTFIKEADYVCKDVLKDIKPEFIKCFEDYDWDWYYISTINFRHGNIEQLKLNNDILDLMMALPDKNWNWGNITTQFGLDYELCDHDKFVDLITSFPDKPWDWTYICEHELVYCNWSNTFLKLIKQCPDQSWDWELMSRYCTNNYFDFIRSHLEKPWNWEELTRRNNRSDYHNELISTIENILLYPDLPWDWVTLSYREDLFDIFEKLPDKPWNWFTISHHYNLTIEFILKNPNNEWDWKKLSRRKDIATINNILSFYNLPWDFEEIGKIDGIWKQLCVNQKMSIDFLALHKDKPLDWEEISRNIHTLCA